MMKYLHLLFFLSGLFCMTYPVLGIVPKPGIALEEYTNPAKKMNNIGRLIVEGEKKSSCSSTLIGIDGDVGIVLTAGHCAELTSEEVVTKCRYQTLSFAPKNTDTDPQKIRIIGRFALGKYIERKKDGNLAYDIGLVFVDLRDLPSTPAPQHIQLDPSAISKKSMVQVVGYGKTSFSDNLSAPQRRIMSTQAFLTQREDRELILLDETGIENDKLPIPAGDHPAEGDSGGPIIDTETGAIIGVVSHRSGSDYYSEPLYAHADWLLAQIKNASRYFIFRPKKSGKLSNNTTWDGNRRPTRFRNAYGEINPIVEIDHNHTLILDDPSSLYAINVVGLGGSIDIQRNQSTELLRVLAPTVITSSSSQILTIDDVNIGTSKVSIQTQLRVLHAFNVLKGVILDVQHEDPNRGITLVERGNINVDGTLKTHHINFNKSTSTKDFGCLSVCGTLHSTTPLNHFSQIVQGTTSSPGKIIGDYSLSEQGILSFNIDTTSPSSVPILTIDGKVRLTGGAVHIKAQKILPVGFEQTILSAKELSIAPSWRGIYYANSVDQTSEVVFTHEDNKVRIKVIPTTGGVSTSSGMDDLVKY